MENLELILRNTYKDKTVIVTGHTGFKGTWLTQALIEMGAHVVGISDTEHGYHMFQLFKDDKTKKHLSNIQLDIRQTQQISSVIRDSKPDFIFHLAAQPITLQSYKDPLGTLSTNINGTINLLEAIRVNNCQSHNIFITSDKCYENQERDEPYDEDDRMGGHDPYSCSKGCCELIIDSYRRSFGLKIASGRAGNVIGGGDWGIHRLVPDCIIALSHDIPISVRNKDSTRPWQHVLHPVIGYMVLGAALNQTNTEQCDHNFFIPENYNSGFNFGPIPNEVYTVEQVVKEILKHWLNGSWKYEPDENAKHENKLLNLSIDKTSDILHWDPILTFEEMIELTMDWYIQDVEHYGAFSIDITRTQILQFIQDKRHILNNIIQDQE